MNFNLVSKNNMGYASALLLVVLLSQSKVFNFLIDTTLGRSILLLFILFIAYTNKILGVVAVLFVIIIFNNSDIGYLESFTDSMDASGNTAVGSGELAQKIQDKKNSMASTTSSTTPATTTTNTPSTTTTTTPSTTTTSTPTTTDTTTTTATSSAIAIEGFDIVGKERSIQKGNQSNQIPVNDFMRVSPDVSPYEGGSFSESFSPY
jgi:cytoskeletal protein RodZ